MKVKMLRIFGVLIFIAGIAALFFSNYIMTQVLQGKSQIASGEKKVKQSQQLFSISPYTQDLGKGLTGSAENKIAQGKEQVTYYENLAQNLKTGGIIGCIAGVGLFALSFAFKKQKRSK